MELNPYTPPRLQKESGGASESPSLVRQGPAGESTASDAPPPVVPKKVLKDPVTGRFMAGHGGRPKGSKNKVVRAIESLMEGEAEQITRLCIVLAKGGDPTALKIVMDRIAPVRKGRALPQFSREQGEGSIEALLRAVLDGEITPEEGKSVVNLIESAAQVAAAQALADIRRHQLEVLKKASEGGVVPSGIMMVPLLAGLDDWEAQSVPMQQALKAKVRE